MYIGTRPPSQNLHLLKKALRAEEEEEVEEEQKQQQQHEEQEGIAKGIQKICAVQLLHVLIVVVVSSGEVCRCSSCAGGREKERNRKLLHDRCKVTETEP